MAQVSGVCAIDEKLNNRLRIHSAPVRHNAAETNGTSTASHRHSAARSRRRKAQESQTPDGVEINGSASLNFDDLSSRLANQLDLKVCSNGTATPKVDTSDTARYQTAHLNGYTSPEHCQHPSTEDVQNADGKKVLANSTNIALRTEPANGRHKRTSDGLTQTRMSRPSNGVSHVSIPSDSELFPATAVNGVPVFDYLKSDKCDAPNKKPLRTRSAIEYRVPCTSISETSVNGFPAIGYPSDDGDSAVSDARNEQRIVPKSESDGTLAKVGDFDREREIERRMRELGLWEYKRAQERHLAELLEQEISERDGLTAALRRCRRRQRGQSAAAADDIRSYVNHQFIRDVWGRKVAYEVRILMGCFTRDVAYMNCDNVVTVQGATSDPGVTLTKEMTIELPDGVDSDDVTVSYAAGVVRIRAPVSQRRRNLARSATRSLGASSDSSNSVSSSS